MKVMREKKSVKVMFLSIVATLPLVANDSCTIRLTAQLVKDILEKINIIKPKVTAIQVDIANLSIDISEQLSQIEASLSSQIDNISCASVSGIDGIEEQLSEIDAVVGELDQAGTCLDSPINVPDDINDLNLTIIQLLKTILLELRGFAVP